MSPSTSSNTSSEGSSIVSLSTAVLRNVVQNTNLADSWHRLVMASVVSFAASAVWYFSCTVIEVTDDEQSLWIQMWLSQQSSALQRVRRLVLLSPAAKMGRQNMDPYGGRGRDRAKEEDEKEDDGGRFAPPKLDFQPACGVSSWTWLNWWPISVASVANSGMIEPYGRGGGSTRAGYTLTVWFAPTGTAIAKDLLLQGRQLWLAKRAKKTEIWLRVPNHHPVSFKVVSKPSRPFSSIIVEGSIKNDLRQDAIRFLNSEKWYVGKGIPYRRGYLLHGPPGCGKTSLITALAGELRLPIVLVPLNDRDMDDRSLMELLGDAPRDSIVLIEDIDCALPKSDGGQSKAALHHRMMGRLPVTLSGLLNAIDGVGAQEGRLLFMTTNHVDRLDEALIRPGRVDVRFHLSKASREAAGELFDQFFASSALHDNFDPQFVKQGRFSFLEKVSDGAHTFAALQGVFMLARDDPRLVATAMDGLLSAPGTLQDPTKHSPRDTFIAVEKANQKALDKEREDKKTQEASGKTVIKRLTGNPFDVTHDIEKQQIAFQQGFSTFGAPGMLASKGVLYFEIEILKARGLAQFGFAVKDGIPISEGLSDVGVGDNGTSWSVDGSRSCKWHGDSSAWHGRWKDGDVIGLAANVDAGVIAVSMDGSWENHAESKCSVVFRDDSIKKGVFPCFTCSSYALRYKFSDESFKYGPPPDSAWEGDKDAKKGQQGNEAEV